MPDAAPSPPTPERVRDRLLAKAAALSEIARSLGLDALAGTIESDTRRRLDDARIRVAVLGEIKQGKSTLINALVGEEILPTGVTPTTGAVVQVRVGKNPGAELVRETGASEALVPDRFARLARGGSTEPDERGTLVVNVATGSLPDSLELCDTPGINDIAKFRAAISEGELPRADVLVLVLDATQLLNRTAMTFLRDAITAVGGLDETSGARLLVVVNRIDLIAERERPKLVEHIERELASIGPPRPDGTPAYELFLTDARTASRAPETVSTGVDGVRQLRARLVELVDGREDTLPRRARAGLIRHDALLAHNAAVAAHALTLERKALRREIDAMTRDLGERESDLGVLRAKMASARDALLDESGQRIVAFRKQLQASLLACLDTASQRTLSAFLPGSIHDAYLAFAHQESERLRVDLDEVTRQAIATQTEQVRRRLFHATMRLGFIGPTVYLDPPSVALEAGMVAIGLAGTAVMYFGNIVAGMVMTVAGPLATVVLREKSLRDARARAKAELPGALDRSTEILRDQIRRVIDDHLGALDEHLLLANVALGEQLTAVLRRAQEEMDGATAGTLESHRKHAIGQLRAIETQLWTIRRELEAIA